MLDWPSFAIGSAVTLAAGCLGLWAWYHFAPFDPDGIKAYRERLEREAKRKRRSQQVG